MKFKIWKMVMIAWWKRLVGGRVVKCEVSWWTWSESQAVWMRKGKHYKYKQECTLPMIAQKIHKMWRRKRGSKWRNFSRRTSKEKKDKDKSSIICCKCKKPRHFKCKCPKLEKGQDKMKYYKTKEKKGLMSTWEDLDVTSD